MLPTQQEQAFRNSDGHHREADLLWQPHSKSEVAAGHDRMEEEEEEEEESATAAGRGGTETHRRCRHGAGAELGAAWQNSACEPSRCACGNACHEPSSRSVRWPQHPHVASREQVCTSSSLHTGCMEFFHNTVADFFKKMQIIMTLLIIVLPPFQIIRHSNNFGESKFFIFDQIYIIE